MLCLSFDPANNDRVVLEFDDGRRVVLTTYWGNKHRVRIAFDADPGVLILRGSLFAEQRPGVPIVACPPRADLRAKLAVA